ncbi:evC complex member EVC isoform X1 [Misgurnus anguillicaudatus]|uniref:evC complex member EVC isoform X1 n=1 Tax=Misgurnus anguillicaudatus TaxID=75329 RepID=UPI003CCF6A6B
MFGMPFNASSDACSSDVFIELTEPLRLLSAPVTGTAASGVCLALFVAALVYLCYRKRLKEVQRRQEVCEQDSQSRRSQPAKRVDPQLTVNTDVAAFALKARVVYPINQRYRPLADGASNPSLHEKCPGPPNRDSASSSGDDWLSQERDNDESIQFLMCSSASKAHTSHQYKRVQYYPQTLGQSRTSLLCLTLQELQLYTTQLQQEKYRIFLWILGVLLGDREHADIINAQQQQEVEMLKREMPEDMQVESDTLMSSVEEVEKTGRHKLSHSLNMALSFAKQLERLYQNLHSKFSSDDAQEVMRMLTKCLQLVETVLTEIQASILKTLMDRFEWWDEVSDWLREKTALLKREAELVVKLMGQSVEPLRSDDQLEKPMNEFKMSVTEELQQWIDEIRRLTDELSRKHCEKVCMRRKMMMKAQSSDWPQSDTRADVHHMLQVLMDLHVNRWNQWRDFELQQDARITDALCERWRSLCGKCTRRLTDLSTEFVESNIPAGSTPSTDFCQSVLKSVNLSVTNQINREERHAHTHLQKLREQLQRCRQVWTEEEALALCCLNHFGEEQRKIVTTMVSRNSHVNESCVRIEDQHHLLILEFQRILAARYFYLRTVREMQLTQLKIDSDAQNSDTSPGEAAVIGQNLRHEQLSELETAAEMLQEHAHFLFGHALAQTVRLKMGRVSAGDAVWTDRCVKEGLIDILCESVYVTRDSVLSLICEYYTRIQHIAMTTLQQLRPSPSTTNRRACTKALQTELKRWAGKPNSTELLHRIAELKKKCLMEFEKEQHHSPVQTHTYRRELMDEEEAFIRRLAALARVSLDNISKDYMTGPEVGQSH